MADPTGKNLTQSSSMQTVGSIMGEMQQEIIATKSGGLTPELARIIAKFRSSQIKLIEQMISVAKLHKKNGTVIKLDPEMVIGMSSEPTAIAENTETK